MDTPTAEQFEALSGAFERYRSEFWNRVYTLDHPDKNAYTSPELAALASKLNDAHRDSFDASLHQASADTYNWLHSTPAFQVATKSLPIRATEGFADFFERQLIQYYQRENGRQRTLWPRLINGSGLYLDYISGVALACHNYLTGKSVRAALSGAETIARMNRLVDELTQLSASDWIDANDQGSLFGHITRVGNKINDIASNRRPSSKRNDPDLATRLMAGELIRLHCYHFDGPHKRAVFQLMGLPFIDKPLEMRTIERLIKAKKKPSHAQVDRVTKSDISDELLTTEEEPQG
ncbi:hypothetical protein [Pseudomonas sp. GWSMS-1]|uniref:hypothetical protein n=1 Tax=Pseudomonas sp. GWSMS-1 TaxID=3308997 RepID=UPI003CF80002